MLSKTYHADLVKMLQGMASDLQADLSKEPVGVEKTKAEFEALGDLG